MEFVAAPGFAVRTLSAAGLGLGSATTPLVAVIAVEATEPRTSIMVPPTVLSRHVASLPAAVTTIVVVDLPTGALTPTSDHSPDGSLSLPTVDLPGGESVSLGTMVAFFWQSNPALDALIPPVPSVSAVKRIDADGFIVAAIDRDALNPVRGPEVLSRHRLARCVQQVLADQVEPVAVNPTELIARHGGRVAVFTP